MLAGPVATNQILTVRLRPVLRPVVVRSTTRFAAYRSKLTPDSSSVESAHDLLPARVVSAWNERNVEGDAIEQAVVFLFHLCGDFVVRAGDGVHFQHLVGNLRRHSAPITARGLLVQAQADLAPAVLIENDLVGAGGSIKGHLLANR